jgi:hypothetical protein
LAFAKASRSGIPPIAACWNSVSRTDGGVCVSSHVSLDIVGRRCLDLNDRGTPARAAAGKGQLAVFERPFPAAAAQRRSAAQRSSLMPVILGRPAMQR